MSEYQEIQNEKSCQLIKDFANLVNGSCDSEILQNEYAQQQF